MWLKVLVVPALGAVLFALGLALYQGAGTSAHAASSGFSLSFWGKPAAAVAPANNLNPNRVGGGDIVIDNNALVVAGDGPSGTILDIQEKKPSADQISIYVVRDGDTLSQIGKLFDVSPNTILWANDLKSSKDIHPGDTLVILPVTGLKYTVAKGDTLAKIAKKFGADAEEIETFNNISGPLAAGTEIIIPDGEVAASSGSVSAPARAPSVQGTASQIGYYLSPLARYSRSQGIHGYNGVDLAAPVGTPIFASAQGTVIIARSSGWNGGYGEYVVIQHPNGTQTLYAHMSNVIAYTGQFVVQGQVIGYVGSTGKSTGAHLHFEIRGGIRNPF